MSSELDVGNKAPDFTLLRDWTGEPGEEITLSDELEEGPVVLVFFPAAFSSVCTEELCTFRDAMAEYNKLGAQVLAISVDGVFANAAFKDKNDLQFPLLSDWNKEVIEDYGVVLEDLLGMKNVAKRAVFVVKQDGTISYTWVSDDPGKLPPFEEIKKAVEDIA
ncbi:MAG: redoxin domain-containing protein [Candidatus Lokiarchaeota archaeon]|nr:redoxin domain-containing protein [Candidatus Lokiarchaeota archaeon]